MKKYDPIYIMSTFVEVVKRFIRPYATIIIAVIVLIIFIIAGYYAYNKFYVKEQKIKDSGYSDVANAITDKIEVIVYFFHVDWCPHCHSAKPEFEKLGAIQTIGGKKIACKAIDAEKNPDKVLSKVSGYPTFQLYDAEGKLVQEYQGERNEAGFRSFLEDVKNRL